MILQDVFVSPLNLLVLYPNEYYLSREKLYNNFFLSPAILCKIAKLLPRTTKQLIANQKQNSGCNHRKKRTADEQPNQQADSSPEQQKTQNSAQSNYSLSSS